MLPKFIERHLQPLPLPQSLDDWEPRRKQLRQDILHIVGLDDLLPASWDLNVRLQGTIERDEYRIEKLTYESYPGFTNAAHDVHEPADDDARTGEREHTSDSR